MKKDQIKLSLIVTIMFAHQSSYLSFIQQSFLLLKAHYYLYFSAYGVINPVLSMTLQAHELLPTEIFYSNLIIQFLTFLTTPLIGFINDRSRRYIFTMNVILCLMICIYAVMFALPSVKSHPIRAETHQINNMQHVLDLCTHDELPVHNVLFDLNVVVSVK